MDNHSSCWTVLARSFHFASLQFFTSVTGECAVSCFKLRPMNTRYTWLNGIFWNALLQECPFRPKIPSCPTIGYPYVVSQSLSQSVWCPAPGASRETPPSGLNISQNHLEQPKSQILSDPKPFAPCLMVSESRKGVDCSDQSWPLPLVMIRPIDPEQQLSLSLAAQWMCRPRSGRPPSLAEVPRACVGPTRFSTNPISPALELVFPPMPSYSDRKGYNLGAQSTPQTRFRKLFRLFSGGAGVPIDPTGLLTADCKHQMMMSPEIVPFVLFRLPSYGPFCTWTSGQIKATAQTATVKNPGTPLAWTGPVLCMNELLTWAHLICSFGKKRSHKQNAYPDHTCFDSTWAKVSRDTPKMR